MPLQAFSFPFPETRFIKAGSFIYKLKIRGGSSFSGEEVMEGNCFNQELEEIIRTVLGNLDNLQPFSSTHFNVFPYKKQWEGMSKVMCNCKRKLRVFPFILILYLEKNMQNGKQAEKKLSPEKETAQQIPSVSEPLSKRCRRDSPLEEALLKDLNMDLEAEHKVSVVRLHMNEPHDAGEEVKEGPGHGDKKETKKSAVNTVRGSGTPGEVHLGTNQDTRQEEVDEGEENADLVPETRVKPGILTRLASHVFPFSLFFRDR